MINRKTLILLRHGKAENGAATDSDHSRKLAPRGIEAATLMGRYMAGEGLIPHKVLCSNSVRTTQTFACVQQAFDRPLAVEYSQKLYHASAGEMLKIIAAVGEEVNSILIVGHNPGMHQLTLQLTREGDERLLDIMHLKFPTCTLAAISADASWYDFGEAYGTLERFVTPSILGAPGED